MSHSQTVQSIYEAFGRGDIAAIVGHLAEDVVWEYDKAAAGIPWLVPRRGRAEASGFFEALGAVEFQKFQPEVQLESDLRCAGLLGRAARDEVAGAIRGGF